MCKTPDVEAQRSGRLYALAVALGVAAYTVVFTTLAVLRKP